MGHSDASLYKNASTRCPFTYGSFGRFISCGVISVCDPPLCDVLSAARAFALPLKNGEEDGGELIGADALEGLKAGCDGERFSVMSELYDCDRAVIGTVRWLISLARVLDCEAFRTGSSGGISSAGGRGNPCARATNWCSVQVSL